jgi:hypothetical protein
MKNQFLKKCLLMLVLVYSSNSYGQYWKTNGNAAAANNFIGTTNATSLTFKTNTVTRMTMLSTGNIGIGTTAPSAQFHTTGTVRFQGLVSNLGLTNVVVADASGNLAVRDINSFAFNNTWNTTGNFGGGFIGTNNLTALPFKTNNIERMRITENGSVGIGTNNPNAQLHTTGSVLFSGLSINPSASRYLVADPLGNVSYKDVNSINDFWGANGNFANVGNFIGSTNNIAVVFKTNAVERLRISETGSVGIGTNNPGAQLHTTSTVRFGGLPTQANAPRLIVSDASGNIGFSEVNTLNTFWKSTGNSISGAEFIGTSNNADLVFKTNGLERLRISSAGNIGIGTVATTRLHVNCNSNILTGVRFELLPFGMGTVLVQDFAGNVLNSGIEVSTLINMVQNKTSEADRIEVLENEIKELKKLLLKVIPSSNLPIDKKSILYQSYPNPTNGLANIKLFVQENEANVKCNLYDINNVLIQSYSVNQSGEQVLSIDTQKLNVGVYFYTLEIGGKMVDSKKLVIQR